MFNCGASSVHSIMHESRVDESGDVARDEGGDGGRRGGEKYSPT